VSSDPLLLIGNLDCESDFLHSVDRSCPIPAPGKSLLKKISTAATLLSVFAEKGDHLWLPAMEDVRAMTPFQGFQEAVCLSDRLPEGWDGPILPWGATERVARLKAGSEPCSMPVKVKGSVISAVRHAPVPDPAAASAANDRLALPGIREAAGCVLPGVGQVRSIQDLEGQVAILAAAAPEAAGWILKGRLSAAGRDRVLHEDGNIEGRVRKLIRKQGGLLFEPWMPRTSDFGCSILVRPGGSDLVEVHRLHVTPRGLFRGIELLAGAAQVRPIAPEPFERYLGRPMAATMSCVVTRVADELREAGYLGPAGVDFWTWQGSDGTERLNPIGEINARMTFGLVAAALSEKLGPNPHRYPDGRFRLSFSGPNRGADGPGPPKIQRITNGDVVELRVRG
jgi:hypothetical protein